MSFHILSEGTGPSALVPTDLSRIPVSLISVHTDCVNRRVEGRVVHKGPLVSAVQDFILKAVIEEKDSSPHVSSQNNSINVFLLGALAKKFSQDVNQGDMILVSGFTVEKSPTASKDRLHPCNLLLSGDSACIYVFREQPSPDPSSLVPSKRSSTLEVSKAAKAPKYTYVQLGDLKAGSVVNVYGVVVFFKQPFRSRGTDFCSSLKITDQSKQRTICTIFCDNREKHPQIYQAGDIVRLHRVKAQLFDGSINLVNTFGFSALTFDGAVGGAVEPRTSSQSFHFDEEDKRTVEELRSWAAGQVLFPQNSASIPLSAVQPKTYFNLTCQLLAKAPVDSTCTLLKVWDGTRCPHTLLNAVVEPAVTEGPTSFSKNKENFIANVLVFDNHTEMARQLKPGAFLRINNLQATSGSSKVLGLASSQSEGDHLAFYLHGGTSYGRGIGVLPENSAPIQELKRVLDSFPVDVGVEELNDSDLLEVWGTPPESLESDCSHHIKLVPLSELKQSNPDQMHNVRVQLRSYQPRRLYQALKLFCRKCTSIQEIPDDELVADVFSEASKRSESCTPPWWALRGNVNLPGDSPDRTLSIYLPTHLVTEGKTKELLFLMGSTLEETCRLAASYQNVVPVTSSGGHLAPLDSSAPFLFTGRKRYYGCKRCSEAAIRNPSPDGLGVFNAKTLAEAFSVQLLEFVLLMKLEVQDATDTLEVLIWKDAELFLGVSAEDIAVNQEAQNHMCQTMDSLCPPESRTGRGPWLDLCLKTFRGKDDGGQDQNYYHVCNAPIIKNSST
ncbi:protection of telomeres protein 1 [Cololabis saira]|uniref:protection of telomeres protein 1 n=1 Tax=Cololabis saira TaxID=129043 RepID=UPI002AD4A95C|nr:protection of telomeres protein 1 [Cololabis saira]XP_061578169.1 protection of telomeres protein 1 [Cololabis saira]